MKTSLAKNRPDETKPPAPRVGLIWAEGRNREIGAGGGMPWNLPEDLAHFAAKTAGTPVVMGRATWESLPEKNRPLPGRANVVISRQAEFQAAGTEVAPTLERALELAAEQAAPSGADDPGVWVIGGASIYRQALALRLADVLEVTEIDAAFPAADKFAPDFRADSAWQLAHASTWHTAANGLRYRFCTYVRS